MSLPMQRMQITAIDSGEPRDESGEQYNPARRRLPPEVLVLVFSFLVLDERPYRPRSLLHTEDLPPYPPLGWIRLGHVNQGWRAALLNHAFFWASEIGVYPHAIHDMLVRAGPTAPLRVHIPLSGGNPYYSGLTELSLACMSDEIALRQRLQTLIVQTDVRPPGSQLKKLAPIFSSPLPKLRDLELLFEYFSEADKKVLRTSLDAPNLREIALLNCCFVGAWHTPNLVSLHIVMSHRPKSEWAASPDNILGVLSVCRSTIQSIRLKGVFCDDCLANADEPVIFRAHSVHLPHLTSIYLSEFAFEASDLLSSLTYPSTACTKVDVTQCRQGTDEIPAFQSLVRSALQKYPHCLNALRMHDDGLDQSSPDDEFDIDLYELPSAAARNHRCSWFVDLRPSVSFHFECDGSPYHIYPYIRDFFTEDILVPVLLEQAMVLDKLAFALREVQGEYDTEEESGPERHVGHIMDYASSATDVVVQDPYVYGCPVMDALCRPERLPGVETLCLVTRPGGKNEIYCGTLTVELRNRASLATTVHIDKAFAAPEYAGTPEQLKSSLEGMMAGVIW
ncbi:hypothetical protein PENSPDRAFT_118676 [Peniophora sp. CONT]|nr:hypothetical protein PENSPDRAFT_118676 [Peniophora sp. CONT]